MPHTGPIELNQVYRYTPPAMPAHPAHGQLVRITGLLYDPRTATTRIRTRGAGGQYEPTEQVFRRDYTPAAEQAEAA